MANSLRSYQGTKPKLAEGVYVDEAAVLVGDIFLDQDASVWPMVTARGDVNHIHIGKRSSVQDGTVLHVTRKSVTNPEGHPLLIGDDVTIGHKAMLHGCKVGNRVLVGMGAIILDGVIIEDDVILGAGSLVPPGKVLKSGFLYIGSPAKQARPLTEAERQFLPQSADNYVRLKDEYLAEQSSTD
ncbi:gamma carbonic anhydrase family protein [Shewanella algae]|uniref:gamma carbonic anhydrase family protein n=1 Tax=Shewanella algae TaxID=38313 RepID=UPI0006D1654D|nr:gamma carbonic anhydrase family protein [Shewanella algae]MBO2668817.1 gamma carbonic anhydrase family protein [Shewanella algae]PST66062.1 gamma carbonic anhydrase family protein [Shewanella algae]TVK91084.1 gamma carbonic anhydrase family protein [Shewanella algae]BCV30513.1 gamma carbonic anhydrase family protein [Shewanella algae]